MIDESDKFGKLTAVEYALLNRQERDIYDAQKDNIIYAKYRESLQQTMYESQKLLAALPEEVHKGLNEVRIMFLVQFTFGIALVVSAVALSFIQQSLAALILGGSGAATLVTSLIMTPPMRLQDNRVDMSQWLMAFNRWFYTTYNVDNIERKRMRYDPDLERDWRELEYYNNYVNNATRVAGQMMEDFCEFQKALGTNGNNKRNNKNSTPAQSSGDSSKQAAPNGN